MNIQSHKLEFIEWLLKLKDEAKLKQLLNFKNHLSRSQKALTPAELKAIEEGLEDFANGDGVDHSEARKLYGKWLSNSMVKKSA
jgi:hypothetical protein